ncbi:DUF3226 domain-containing protein [Spirosoma sp. SC4-14]|uniref:DUF3226 domain-containing protein n=1 Tax=Spirosoma sp. SC4-14 TaxID=3128900 RepID=UPI0030CFD351
MILEEKFNAKLLVEGHNDQHVAWAICRQHHIAETFDVIDCKSISNLKQMFSVYLKQGTNTAVGIIIDADQNLDARWASISGILIDSGYMVPTTLPNSGLILPAHTIFPVVGIWIMPDNTSIGMLEDFITNLIPDTDPLKAYVNVALNTLEQTGHHRYNVIHRSKAYVHTFLSWQEDPGTPMGQAITKHYLDHNAAQCINFIDWLNALFNPNVA